MSFVRKTSAAVALLLSVPAASARAEVPVQSTLRYVPSSNGHAALMLDVKTARLTHFREHTFAAEEPLLDAGGKELWNGNQPLAVPTRDLLFHAHFGLRANGKQAWLTGDPIDAKQTGYLAYQTGKTGGKGLGRVGQARGTLTLTPD